MRLKENNLLKKIAATLKKFSAQGAKKVEYGILHLLYTLSWVHFNMSTSMVVHPTNMQHLLVPQLQVFRYLTVCPKTGLDTNIV